MPNISLGITVLPAGSEPTAVMSGVSPNVHYQLGIPANALPLFSVVTNTLAPGSQATATIDNANPAAPILTLGIPRGANGENGFSVFTGLLDASYIQPTIGNNVTITVGTNAWARPGLWIHIRNGGYYIVQSVTSDDSITIRNPNQFDLAPYWGPTSGGIPTNRDPGLSVSTDGTGNQVVVCGVPGLRGIAGAAGAPVEISIGTGIPLDPPPSADAMTLRYDDAVAPTWQRLYVWNTTTEVWDGGPNMLGARGSRTFFGPNDPNTIPVPGSQPGDVWQRTNGSVRQSYTSIGGGSWTLNDTFSLLGTITQVSEDDVATTYVIDSSIFSHLLVADMGHNITLDTSSVNYTGQGQWTIQIRNAGGTSIDIDLESGKWIGKPGVTMPLTIGTGNLGVIRFIKDMTSTKYIVTEAFVLASI